MVFYTNRFVKEGCAGAAIGPFIFIRPDRKDDIGLLLHEKVHVRQFWQFFPIFGLIYRFYRHRRMDFEVEAYAVQAKAYTDDRVPLFAKYVAEKYDLGVTPAIAERAIRRAM